MARIIKIFILFSAFISLHTFAACYGVRIWPPEKTGESAVVKFNGASIGGIVLEQPPTKVCKPIPETVEVKYTKRQKDSLNYTGWLEAKQPIYVRRNMPKGFLKNPARLIEFQVHEDGAVSVLFRMKLSEITTKFISHEETEAEKQKRLNDEMLWLGIINNNAKSVKAALENGATTEQPWMERVRTSHYTEYTTFYASMRSKNPEIVRLLMKAKVKYFEDERNTILWFKFSDPLKEKDSSKVQALLFQPPEYVGSDLARVLLENGANPNYGLRIPFAWNKVKWRDRPGMPEYADLKDPPYDRLIYLAVKNDDIELVRLLLEHGAETHYRLPANREPPDWWKEGEWFLDWAKREASPEVKAVLFSKK